MEAIMWMMMIVVRKILINVLWKPPEGDEEMQSHGMV